MTLMPIPTLSQSNPTPASQQVLRRAHAGMDQPDAEQDEVDEEDEEQNSKRQDKRAVAFLAKNYEGRQAAAHDVAQCGSG